jgi:hypothetical protein
MTDIAAHPRQQQSALSGHAHTNAELVDAARAQIAELASDSGD